MFSTYTTDVFSVQVYSGYPCNLVPRQSLGIQSKRLWLHYLVPEGKVKKAIISVR